MTSNLTSKLKNQITFESIRKKFPGTWNRVYLDVASHGLLSSDVREALDVRLDELLYGRADKDAYFTTTEHVRDKFARLINADSDEIAFTKNTSDGLNIIAAAMPWKTGDNIVLCRDLEHPNNIYPWLNLGNRLGIEVRDIPGREDAIDVEAMIAAIDGRTRLVTVSTVTFAPGFRTDIEPLGHACREKGVFLLLDGAQSVGVIDMDVRKFMVDGLAVATQKALLGLYGMGFLFCRHEWAKKMAPVALARFSVDFGSDMHEATTGDAHYDLMPGAQRFDIGNYNYPAVFAIEPALDLLLEVGVPAIEAHVCGLAYKLAAGLRQLGITVSGGAPGPHLSHIVTASVYSQDSAETDSLYRHLIENDVKLTVRRGMLRFSMHIYNNLADIDRLLDLVQAWKSIPSLATGSEVSAGY